MKKIALILVAFHLLSACHSTPNTGSDFDKHAATVLEYLHQYEAENIDYAGIFASGFTLKGTWQGSKDSLNLEEAIAKDSSSFALFDFKILTDPLVFLPGVDTKTKKENGSVRYYGKWLVTLPATDSSEAQSTTIEMYESFDFDENGKVLFQEYYGDFGGMRDALLNP